MIKCNGAQFNVHRVIVCPRSAILRAMLDGSFKVIEIKCCCWTCADFAKETESGMIDLSEDDQCIVGYMLDCLYTADYDGSESNFEGLHKSAAGQSSLNKDIEIQYVRQLRRPRFCARKYRFANGGDLSYADSRTHLGNGR